MPEAFFIRKYQANDREECRYLWRKLTEWHREIYGDQSIGDERPEEYFDKHLVKVGPDNLWVAVHNAQVIGLVGLMSSVYDEFEIEPLIVSEVHRSKGIGTCLVETVIAEARKRGLRSLSVSPVARNMDTIKFLYKLGFRNLGHVQLFLEFTDYKWKEGPTLFGCKFKF